MPPWEKRRSVNLSVSIDWKVNWPPFMFVFSPLLRFRKQSGAVALSNRGLSVDSTYCSKLWTRHTRRISLHQDVLCSEVHSCVCVTVFKGAGLWRREFWVTVRELKELNDIAFIHCALFVFVKACEMKHQDADIQQDWEDCVSTEFWSFWECTEFVAWIWWLVWTLVYTLLSTKDLGFTPKKRLAKKMVTLH